MLYTCVNQLYNCESILYMLHNIKKDLHYKILSSNLAAHQGNKSLTLNVKNMETTKNQETIGKPSARILKAFQVLCDANTLMGSKWVNPVLSVLSNSTVDSTCFWVKCDSICYAYGRMYVDIHSITIASGYIEIMYSIDNNFDCMYDYKGNPKNKELFT